MSSFHKAVGVLSLIADSPKPLRFTDLLRASGHPKATLHRLLSALTSEGLIMYDGATQTYRPGLRLLELAHRSWMSLDLCSIAVTDVNWLAEETGETVHLAQFDGDHFVYIDKRESKNSLRLYSAVGKRGPMHCTGVGKSMLATLDSATLDRLLDTLPLAGYTPSTITDVVTLKEELQAIRQRGCAFDMEEHEQGVRCAAAAITGGQYGVIGALSVTAPAVRMTDARLTELQPLVIETANRIADTYGFLH